LDTGFLVFNQDNYPNLTRLFERLGVESQETDMSFGISCERCDVEYSGHSIRGLFAQRRNLLRPSHYRMLADIERFNRAGRRALEEGTARNQTLGEFLSAGEYGRDFSAHYLVPMASALWSSGTGAIEEFPMQSLLRFFETHGLLQVKDRLKWRTVSGGSQNYVRAVTRDFEERVHLNTPVKGIARTNDGPRLFLHDGSSHLFDRVVIAAHADQALAMLCDPSREEHELLSRWSYSRNDTWLHTDTSHLPRRPAAWASWSYMQSDCQKSSDSVSVSYYLNRLQQLETKEDFIVTLNPARPPAADCVIKRMSYMHPVFTEVAVQTQSELPGLNGPRGTYFCGAHFGYGFHEDGLRSAVQVADMFGISMP
jgi:predicted NAD/FAD-binding protein